MLSIAEKKARRAASARKYQSKPENKARHAARQKAYRDAKPPAAKTPSPRPQLSDQEKRDRRNAKAMLLRDAKRTTPKRVMPKRLSRAGLSEEEKRERRARQALALRDAKRTKPKQKRTDLSSLSAQEKADRRIQARKEYARRYRSTHLKEHRDRQKQWLDSLAPDRLQALKQAQRQQRRARKAGGGGSYTKAEWESLCVRYEFRCLCCKEKKPLTVDHVVPLAKGGTNEITNIQPLCISCNCSKGTKTIDYR